MRSSFRRGDQRRLAKPSSDEEAKGKDEKAEKRPVSRYLMASLVVLLGAYAAFVFVAYRTPSPGRELSLDQVFRLAERNTIQSATFLDEDAVIIGVRCAAPPMEPQRPPEGERPRRCYDPVTERFHASYPASQVATQQLIEELRSSSGASIVVDKQAPVAVAKLATTYLFPLLMLANLFALIFLGRSGDGSMGEIATFGRLGRKRQGQGSAGAGVTFADVAGAEEAVVELREVIDYLTDPARFEAYGAAPPKGVMLFGPPGCGKTLLARATAGESGVPFFSASGTEFVESLVGVGAARVRDLFRQVREAAPAMLFIDEIDAVGRRRSGEGTSGGEREQTLNQLLVELDGFEVTSGVVLMGATNRPDILDPALLRPGRFDRHITMVAPAVDGRRQILELHARSRPLGPDVDLAALAARTPGFTGADLANVVNEAALLAIRAGAGTQISSTHLSEAVLRVLHGPQRRGQLLSAEERRRLAYHEAAHALVAAAFGHAGDVHRISIVSRGRGLAQSTVGEDERALLTATEMGGRVAMAMSGVAAEVMVFGEGSTTSEDDISRATALAREMIGIYGMSDNLGWVRLMSRNESGYLGSNGPTLDLVSGPTLADFDAEVRRVIATGKETAEAVLRSWRGRLDEMVKALEERETLEGPGLAAFLTGVGPPTSPTAGPGAAGDAPPPAGRSRQSAPRPVR